MVAGVDLLLLGGLLLRRLRSVTFLDWALDGRRDDTRLDALLGEITLYGSLV